MKTAKKIWLILLGLYSLITIISSLGLLLIGDMAGLFSLGYSLSVMIILKRKLKE